MDWWTQNKDAITAIGATITGLLAIGSIIWAVIKWGFLRGWQRKLRVDVSVFEVITDPAVLLPKLYATENDKSPLADHNIKYQPRDPKRDIQAELKAALNRSRYLLITAPTGYGKTREAGMLAQTLMLEGWRVLMITKTGWLDVPKTFPKELNDNRSRILIFLDDLNGMFSTGARTESPRAEKIPLLSEANYHDRLLQVLDYFEGACTEHEIRVIATARSESDQWKLLDFDEKDELWKRFERFELPKPDEDAIINLLGDAARQANLKSTPDEFEAIAHKNDGTYRNIILNLQRWQRQNKVISKDDLTETLNGSWRDVYERALKKHPGSKYVYMAVFLLQQYKIPLFPFLVKALARKISGHSMLTRIFQKQQISRSFNYLVHHENILSPRDGQIDACPTVRDLLPANYFEKILEVFILPGFFHTIQIELSILQTILQPFVAIKKEAQRKYTVLLILTTLSLHFPFETIALYLYSKGHKKSALNLLKKRRIQNTLTVGILSTIYSELGAKEESISLLEQSTSSMHQDSAILYMELGNRYSDVKRYDEAETAYRKAIELNPDDANAYSNLGNLLSDENLKRYDEAETAYRKAIELNPDDATAYYNLGNLLSDENLKRYDEAETAFRKAIELNPDDATAYYNLGILLKNLKRYDEAETAYRKAIELNPSLIGAYGNLGNLLRDNYSDRYDESETAYRKVIELDPSGILAYNNLGLLLQNLKRYDEAETAFRKAIELNPDYENAHYNLACLKSLTGHIDDAFEYLEKAAKFDGFDPAWAWEDPDLQWIRDDPRFVEIVGPKPT